MEIVAKPIQSLLVRLPFRLDETDKVNALYLDNHEVNDPGVAETIDVWTYCYIRRYFQLKYARDFDGCIADYEKMIADSFRKVSAGRKGLGASTRYCSWVSVICKNTFLNYIRGKKRYVSIERAHIPLSSAEPTAAEVLDARLLFHALQQAIDRLPSFLRTIATLRIIEEKDYETIADETGKEVPTIRSYVNKAIIRLRKDVRFMNYFER